MTDKASDSASMPAEPRKVLAAGCGIHFLHDGISDSLYVLLPLWAEAFGLNHTLVGLLRSAFSAALSAFQIPFGLLAERYGERSLLAAGTLLAGIGLVLMAFVGSYGMLMIWILMIGFASSVQHPLASAIISKAYTSGGRRGALGIYNFSGDLGKMVVPVMIGTGAALIGWRLSTFIYGIAVGVAGLIIYLGLKRLLAGADQTQHAAGTNRLKGWGFTNGPAFAALSAIQAIDASCRYGFLTFLPFVLINKGAEPTAIGFAFGLVFAGGAAGKLVCGLLAERMGIMRTVVLTEIATGALILALPSLSLTEAMVLLPIVGIAINGTSSVLYGTVGDFVSEEKQARAFGLFYTCGTATGALSPLLYGILADYAGLKMVLIVLALSAFLTLPICAVLRRFIAADSPQ